MNYFHHFQIVNSNAFSLLVIELLQLTFI